MDWHARYLEQARWTAGLRAHLFEKARLTSARRVLEVGCGTGALIGSLPLERGVHGLDCDLPSLSAASLNAPAARLTCGDALRLPFAPAAFDLVFCHYLLLWVSDPAQALAEMRRVTRPGGAVLALAEPDYGGRIDHPAELAALGDWQRRSLRGQGADPQAGRRLPGLFQAAGLGQVECGILGAEWQPPLPDADLEWQVLDSDLAGQLPADQLRRLRVLDGTARERGERVLYVPTFYAWGLV